jgi:ribulose kinase
LPANATSEEIEVMTKKKSIVLGAAAFALVLSGTAFAESAEKLEKAHEKAEASVETMGTKESEKLEKAHEKAEANVEGMSTKEAEKMEKAHEKAEEHVEKIEAK